MIGMKLSPRKSPPKVKINCESQGNYHWSKQAGQKLPDLTNSEGSKILIEQNTFSRQCIHLLVQYAIYDTRNVLID